VHNESKLIDHGNSPQRENDVMAVSVSVDFDAKIKKKKIIVDGEVSAKLRVRNPITRRRHTVASVTQGFDATFDLSSGKGTSSQSYGPLKLKYTYSKKEVCVEGRIKVGGKKGSFGKICKKL